MVRELTELTPLQSREFRRPAAAGRVTVRQQCSEMVCERRRSCFPIGARGALILAKKAEAPLTGVGAQRQGSRLLSALTSGRRARGRRGDGGPRLEGVRPFFVSLRPRNPGRQKSNAPRQKCGLARHLIDFKNWRLQRSAYRSDAGTEAGIKALSVGASGASATRPFGSGIARERIGATAVLY